MLKCLRVHHKTFIFFCIAPHENLIVSETKLKCKLENEILNEFFLRRRQWKCTSCQLIFFIKANLAAWNVLIIYDILYFLGQYRPGIWSNVAIMYYNSVGYSCMHIKILEALCILVMLPFNYPEHSTRLSCVHNRNICFPLSHHTNASVLILMLPV